MGKGSAFSLCAAPRTLDLTREDRATALATCQRVSPSRVLAVKPTIAHVYLLYLGIKIGIREACFVF